MYLFPRLGNVPAKIVNSWQMSCLLSPVVRSRGRKSRKYPENKKAPGIQVLFKDEII